MEELRALELGPRPPTSTPATFYLPPSAPVDPTLCPTCRRLDVESLLLHPSPYEYAHLGLYTSIRDKTSTCRFCALVVSAVHIGWRSLVDWETCTLDGVEVGLDRALRIWCYPKPLEALAANINLEREENAGLDILAQDAVRLGLGGGGPRRVRRVDGDVIDPGRVKEWTGICERFHADTCAAEIERNIKNIPKEMRVIDVSEMTLVPVVEGPRAYRTRPYIALSYVWGRVTSLQQYQLTQANVEARMKKGGMINVKFPRTIRDAIETTRFLGARYLWIDAACIIQDSDSDRAAQIGAMNIVYGAAQLTIVAACGQDAQAPLSRTPRSPKPIDREFVEINGVNVTHRSIRLWDLENTPSIRPKWFTRAWTYQERQLSPRLIVFTPQQVFFQCREIDLREDEVREEHKSSSPLADLFNSEPIGTTELLGNRIFRGGLGCGSFMEKYKQIVKQYTIRDLTFDGDALNAFMGVAAMMEEAIGPWAKLHFGLPLGVSFEEALTWQPASTTPMVRRPEFPSWSWAGWRGGVDYVFSANNWMVISGSAQVYEHTIPEFAVHPGPNPITRNEHFAPQFLPPLADPEMEQCKLLDLRSGTLEFVASVAPGTAFACHLGATHHEAKCTCFQFMCDGERPPLAGHISLVVDKNGVACGSMGIYCGREARAGQKVEFVCLALSSAASAPEGSCPDYDTMTYSPGENACFDVMLVVYAEDEVVGEKLAVGRIHKDAWVVAEGLRWKRVWLW